MKRRALLLFITCVALALCAACGWWLYRERRQYALDRQLIAALEHGDTKTALALVNAGADPNTRQTPLPAPSFQELHERWLHDEPSPDNTSSTAFLLACGAIVEAGSDPILAENVPLLRAMLSHGANLNIKSRMGDTALNTALMDNYPQTMELLLQHGADVNAQGLYGATPLMLATTYDHPNVVRLLFSHGANPNVQDVDGNTALYYVLGDNLRHSPLSPPDAKSLIPLLIAHGANPYLPNKDKQTVFELAQKNKRSDVIRLLKGKAK